MLVTCELLNSIALLTLNDQKRLNVLSRELISTLNFYLDEIEKNESIRVVILTGYKNIFSAGANLKELQEYKQQNQKDDFIEEWQRLSTFSKPVIIALNGIAFGGGLELALMGDILIAADDVNIALPELSVGVIPGGGATQRLTHLIGPYKTNYLCMTGNKISAQKALDWGIIQDITSSENIISHCIKLASEIALKPLPLLIQLKKSIQYALNKSLKDGLRIERNLFFETLEFDEHDAAIQSFFNKQKT